MRIIVLTFIILFSFYTDNVLGQNQCELPTLDNLISLVSCKTRLDIDTKMKLLGYQIDDTLNGELMYKKQISDKNIIIISIDTKPNNLTLTRGTAMAMISKRILNNNDSCKSYFQNLLKECKTKIGFKKGISRKHSDGIKELCYLGSKFTLLTFETEDRIDILIGKDGY